MKIEELVSVGHRDEIDSLFKQNGYKLTGTGADARVFKKDSSHVIKVLFPADLIHSSAGLKSFTAFHEFVKANPTSPFLPKISEVNEIEVMGEIFTQIAMEKLMPLKHGSTLEALVYQISNSIEEGTRSFRAMLVYLDENPWDWDHGGSDRGVHMPGLVQSIINDPAKMKFYSEFYDIAAKLHATGFAHPDGPLGWDLHSENVMRRRQTPVIIDPWFSSSSK